MATLTNTSIQDIINSAVKVAVKNKVVWIYGKEANKYNIVSIPVFKDFINNEGDINGVTIINKERLMDSKTIAVVKNYSTDVCNLNGVFADMVSKDISGGVFEKSSTEDISNPMGYCREYSCPSRDKSRYLNNLDAKRKAIGVKIDKVTAELIDQQKFLKRNYGAEFNYTRPIVETKKPVFMGQTLLHNNGITVDCSKSAWSPVTKYNGETNHRTVEALKAKLSYKALSAYVEDVNEFNELKQQLWDLRSERKAVKAKIAMVKEMAVDSTEHMPQHIINGLKAVNYNVNPVNKAGAPLRAKAQLVHVEYRYDESGNRFTVCPHCGSPIRIDSVRKFVAVDATKDGVIEELKPAEYQVNGVKYVLNLRGDDIHNQEAIDEVAKAIAKANTKGKKYVRKERNFKVNEDYNPNQWSDEELGYTSTAEGNDYREASISEEDMQDFWGQGGADIDAERLEEYAKLMISHRNEKSWYKHVRNVSDDIVKVGALTANKWNDSFKLGGFKYYDFVQYEMEVRGNMGLQLNMEKIEQYYNSSKSVVKAMDYDMGDSYDVETGNGGKYTVEDSFYTDMDRYYSNMESNYEDFFTEYGGEFTQGIYNEDEMYGQVQVRPDFKERYDRICTIMTRLSK